MLPVCGSSARLGKWQQNVTRMCAGTAKMLTCVDLLVRVSARHSINEGCGTQRRGQSTAKLHVMIGGDVRLIFLTCHSLEVHRVRTRSLSVCKPSIDMVPAALNVGVSGWLRLLRRNSLKSNALQLGSQPYYCIPIRHEMNNRI